MGCWEIGALLLLVVVLFPKPFFRYASRWMKTVPRPRSHRRRPPTAGSSRVSTRRCASAATIRLWCSPTRGDDPAVQPRPALRAMTLALAFGLAAGTAMAEVQGFHYVREVAVPAPGWVRVPLDLAAVRHLAP